MIPNNNLSVLPWYDSLERQNARKWWMYDKVYPLFVPSGYMLPFQAMRQSRTELAKGDLMEPTDSDRGYLTSDSSWCQDTSAGYVAEYDVVGIDAVYLSDIPMYVHGGVHVGDSVCYVAYDSSDKVLFSQSVNAGTYSGFWTLPQGTTKIRVLTSNSEFEQYDGEVYKANSVPTAIKSFKIYTRCDELVGDFIADMTATGLTIKHVQLQDIDVIVYSGLFPISQVIADGQYYAEMSDGVDTWYSEMFTISKAASSYLKIEWWDVEDFIMDAGAIVYTSPKYRNRIYLPADIAKPEYEFEEESEERDGYIFPIKQISKKTFHFSFLASEYLLDVMRFIRLSDYVEITYKGQRYSVDSFLLSPEWEDYGDVASVDAEFTTATVAKKVGFAYIKSKRLDFNDDFNNDYN
jgi:hypothetical protein